MSVRILIGDCLDTLRELPDASVQTCVTSPPYFGLRDYGHAGQIGLEATPEAFVAKLVAVLCEVRRVLRDDGTLWLNLGDSYAGGGCGSRDADKWPKQSRNDHMVTHGKRFTGLEAKQLLGIPWRVAFALQADGWYLRQDIIWSKPNPMPESVRDRCTKAHEYLFLLSKSPRYYYDADAIAEESVYEGAPRRGDTFARRTATTPPPGQAPQHREGRENIAYTGTRNKRSVWEVSTQPFKGAHFATFPPALIEPCILAGSREGDTVLDPFGGAGTTGMVADRNRRDAILCELNPAYAEIAKARITGDSPLFAEVAA